MIVTTLAEQAAFLARRKAELGITGNDFVLANSGRRRTEAKRELLEVIEREARAQGLEPRFKANIR